jgi:hypothetical protein
MTPAEIRALARLEKAATKGPWPEGGTYFRLRSATVIQRVVSMSAADAAFIPAARNALPALLAELREVMVRSHEWPCVCKHTHENGRPFCMGKACLCESYTPEPL